jgi:hypothetical protein
MIAIPTTVNEIPTTVNQIPTTVNEIPTTVSMEESPPVERKGTRKSIYSSQIPKIMK